MQTRLPMRRVRWSEAWIMALMWASAAMAVLITVAIIYSVVSESWRFFSLVPVDEFLFGLK